MAMDCVPEHLSGREILAVLPSWLQADLGCLWHELGGEVYLAGGVVRDLLLGMTPADIDLTVPVGAKLWAEKLAARTGGAYVDLGRVEDVARVVSRQVTIDFSAFRQGAASILADLTLRDLTVNGLGIRIDPLLADRNGATEAMVPVLDPTGGREDLAKGRIRTTGPESFRSDPLRLLRVFRFAASLNFAVADDTLELVRRQHGLVAAVAPERIAHELDCTMASPQGHWAFALMASTGLLWDVIPELAAGAGMAQPKSHHLDVWEHNLETLRQMERIVEAPQAYFSACGEAMAAYLAGNRQPLRLKWAALLHDLGKPATCAVRDDKGGRITFYNHDLVGAKLFCAFARRLRWSNEDTERVAQLIAGHMRPFHLANVARGGNLTLRAGIRMIRKAGGELPGLFLLSMADALAGQGVERIAGMERELVDLFLHLEKVRTNHVEPVRSAPPLLTGKDLIKVLKLSPSPMFKVILGAVEEARMEGTVTDYAEALQLAEILLTSDPELTGRGEGEHDA
jgi:poly(A) polymerase